MKNHSSAEKNAVASPSRVDVSKIYNGSVSEIVLDFPIVGVREDSLEFDFAADPVVHARVYEKARGRAGAESYVALDLKIEGEYTCCCARCTKELTKTFCIDTTYGITRDEDNDSEEYVIAPDGVLDAEEAARTLFYLSLPQRVLCKQDCRGLCPMCGTDLNVSACSCTMPQRGNRLTDLKKLLDKYQEK